jgi:hypothetical protein
MMSVKEWAVSSALAISLVAPAARPQAPVSEPPKVSQEYASAPISLIRLVAGCNEFEGRTVMTIGYASFVFENFSLCPSPELSQHDPASCFWLTSDEKGIPHEQLKKLEEWNKTWVSIEAKVRCSEYHYAGSLEEIGLIVEHEKGKVLWSTDPALKAVKEPE